MATRNKDAMQREMEETSSDRTLLLSSRAGLGNYRAAEAIREMILRGDPARDVEHRAIEEFLSERATREEFARHRWLCENAPFLLRIPQRLPGFYLRKKWSHRRRLAEFTRLEAHLVQGWGTVIVTNHRAALWTSEIKQRRRLGFRLVAWMTDYHLSAGWRPLYWDAIDELATPGDAARLPAPLRQKARPVEYPISSSVRALRGCEGGRDEVLVTGGGWGLIPQAERVVGRLAGLPFRAVHVVCGSNSGLHALLSVRFADHPKIRLYQELPDLTELYRRCQTVVTRPSGGTLSEAVYLKRKILLLPGLPVVEEGNARWALRNRKAEWFRDYEGTDGPALL